MKALKQIRQSVKNQQTSRVLLRVLHHSILNVCLKYLMIQKASGPLRLCTCRAWLRVSLRDNEREVFLGKSLPLVGEGLGTWEHCRPPQLCGPPSWHGRAINTEDGELLPKRSAGRSHS